MNVLKLLDSVPKPISRKIKLILYLFSLFLFMTFFHRDSQQLQAALDLLSYEPHHKKICLRGLRPGITQTSLLSYRDELEY